MCGVVASIAAVMYVKFFTPLQPFLYVAVGLGVCVGVGYVSSLLIPQRKDLTGLTAYSLPVEEEN